YVKSPTDCSICSYLCHTCLRHRTLHSVPTRRSSDLPGATGGICRARTAGPSPPARGSPPRRCRPRAVRRRPAESAPPHRLPDTRSEEHTSELQSRFDLVCRLLLEKKKSKLDLIVSIM